MADPKRPVWPAKGHPGRCSENCLPHCKETTAAGPIDTPLVPYTRNKLHFLASRAVTDNGRSAKVSVGASNVLQLLDVFTNLEVEVDRLRAEAAEREAQRQDCPYCRDGGSGPR